MLRLHTAEKAAEKANRQASLFGFRPTTPGTQAIGHLISSNNKDTTVAGAGEASGDDDAATVTTTDGTVNTARSR